MYPMSANVRRLRADTKCIFKGDESRNASDQGFFLGPPVDCEVSVQLRDGGEQWADDILEEGCNGYDEEEGQVDAGAGVTQALAHITHHAPEWPAAGRYAECVVMPQHAGLWQPA